MPATPHFLENHERCILDSYLICTIWLCDVISQFSLHSIFLDILYNKKEMYGLIPCRRKSHKGKIFLQEL